LGRQRRHWNSIPGEGLNVWDTARYGEPVAAELPRVAEILGVPLEQAHAAARLVEPLVRADGVHVWSIRLLGVQLGLRDSHYLSTSGKRRRQAAARGRARAREAS
jgi:hypothetical protein